MNIEIADRLVKLRKVNGLSQEALAEKLGISRQAVSKWERAEASPDTDNLIMLARLYKVSLDELLRTEDEIPVPEPIGAEEAAMGGSEKNVKVVLDKGNAGYMANEPVIPGLEYRGKEGEYVGTGGVESQGYTEGQDSAESHGRVEKRLNKDSWMGTEGQSTESRQGYMEGQPNVGEGGYLNGQSSAENQTYVKEGRDVGMETGFTEGKKGENKGCNAAEDGKIDGERHEHIGLDGVHVLDKDGSEVRVGWNGIYVDERKKGDNVHTGRDGVYINGKKYDREWFKRYRRFPVGSFITLLFFAMGIFFGAWHPAWMLFLLIPLWYSFLGAVEKRNANIFAYPVLATFLFLCVGFLFGAWHPGWIIFLTIPLYYSAVPYLAGKGDGD